MLHYLTGFQTRNDNFFWILKSALKQSTEGIAIDVNIFNVTKRICRKNHLFALILTTLSISIWITFRPWGLKKHCSSCVSAKLHIENRRQRGLSNTTAEAEIYFLSESGKRWMLNPSHILPYLAKAAKDVRMIGSHATSLDRPPHLKQSLEAANPGLI